jgi:hypothetical protein
VIAIALINFASVFVQCGIDACHLRLPAVEWLLVTPIFLRRSNIMLNRAPFSRSWLDVDFPDEVRISAPEDGQTDSKRGTSNGYTRYRRKAV